MNRPRKHDRHLPACMYLRHGRYWLVKRGRWTSLGTDYAEALAEYARRTRPAEPEAGMPGLIEATLARLAARVKPSTLAQYKMVAKRLKSAFAEFSPEQVKPKHVAQLMDHHADTPNLANQMRALLKDVFALALRRGLAESNPVLGIERYAEAKRGRYLTDSEYAAIAAQAGAQTRVIMDLCYLTAQRIGDVLAIRYADIGEEGIAFRQAKTGKRLIVTWTPELAGAVEQARALHRCVKGLTLLHAHTGAPLTYKTVARHFREAVRAAGIQDARLHDLRAKSLTDAKAQGLNPQLLAGHASAAMTERYIRRREIDRVSGPRRKPGG